MTHKSEDEDEERVQEWETGLPTSEDLTPLSHQLISLQLASAFSITAEPFQTMLDVNRASQNTLTNLRRQSSAGFSSNNFKELSSFMEERCSDPEPIVVDEEEDADTGEKRKSQCVESVEDGENITDECSARTFKRARLVWTPQLHKRFVEVVAHLGIDNSVPKTIMQLMNVEGLTRENVASHLQKYRLYLKRMNDGGGSSNDHQLFTPAPVNQSESRRLPLPQQPVQMVGASHMGMQMQHLQNSASASYNGFQFHPYSMYREHHQGHWAGNQFNSVVPHSHHVNPNDN